MENTNDPTRVSVETEGAAEDNLIYADVTARWRGLTKRVTGRYAGVEHAVTDAVAHALYGLSSHHEHKRFAIGDVTEVVVTVKLK